MSYQFRQKLQYKLSEERKAEIGHKDDPRLRSARRLTSFLPINALSKLAPWSLSTNVLNCFMIECHLNRHCEIAVKPITFRMRANT